MQKVKEAEKHPSSDSSSSTEGFASGMLAKALANLQVHVKQIHIRLEDDHVSDPKAAFAAGILLSDLAYVTLPLTLNPLPLRTLTATLTLTRSFPLHFYLSLLTFALYRPFLISLFQSIRSDEVRVSTPQRSFKLCSLTGLAAYVNPLNPLNPSPFEHPIRNDSLESFRTDMTRVFTHVDLLKYLSFNCQLLLIGPKGYSPLYDLTYPKNRRPLSTSSLLRAVLLPAVTFTLDFL